MSLADTIRHHEINEAEYAKSAVKAICKGRHESAAMFAGAASMHRHLAYEHSDTQRIALDAFMDHYGRP
jgi:hypothetical protein